MIEGEISSEMLLSLVCKDVISQSCDKKTLRDIISYVDLSYGGLYRYNYSAMGLYLTLFLCGIFILYTVCSADLGWSIDSTTGLPRQRPS